MPCTKSATLRVLEGSQLHLSLCTSSRSLKTAAVWKLGSHIIILTLPLTMQDRIHGLLLSTWHMPGRLDLACASGLETQRKRAGACVHSGELACSRGKCSTRKKGKCRSLVLTGQTNPWKFKCFWSCCTYHGERRARLRLWNTPKHGHRNTCSLAAQHHQLQKQF